MPKKEREQSCCSDTTSGFSCRVESLISVDERGQMVLPKELRDKARIGPGDKLAVISCEQNGETSCLYLIKAEDFEDAIKDRLGPMMREFFGSSGGGSKKGESNGTT